MSERERVYEGVRDDLNRLAATVASVPPSVKILKLGEEYGEAVQAFIGTGGWNPRKGVYAVDSDVAKELADVALSALVAMGEFCPDALACLAQRLAHVADRAEVARRGAAA